MSATYFARIALKESDRLLAFRRRVSEATHLAPVPQALLDAIDARADTAFTTRTVPAPGGTPSFLVIEVDLADWLAGDIATEWPAPAGA